MRPVRRAKSAPRLAPNPGSWSLDWSLADRGGPCPWPSQADSDYAGLAVFLARLNEMSLDDVMALERQSMRSANHALSVEDLRPDAYGRWLDRHAAYHLDEDPYSEIQVLSLSYCLAANDPRRVVAVYDGGRRVMYPLWWDLRHVVSGADGHTRGRGDCTGGCLHPRE